MGNFVTLKGCKCYLYEVEKGHSEPVERRLRLTCEFVKLKIEMQVWENLHLSIVEKIYLLISEYLFE